MHFVTYYNKGVTVSPFLCALDSQALVNLACPIHISYINLNWLRLFGILLHKILDGYYKIIKNSIQGDYFKSILPRDFLYFYTHLLNLAFNQNRFSSLSHLLAAGC